MRLEQLSSASGCAPPVAGAERKGAQSWQVLVFAAAGREKARRLSGLKLQKGSDPVNRDELCDVSDQHMERTKVTNRSSSKRKHRALCVSHPNASYLIITLLVVAKKKVMKMN